MWSSLILQAPKLKLQKNLTLLNLTCFYDKISEFSDTEIVIA